MHHRISIFSNIELLDQSKPCAQIYLQKIATTNSIKKKERLLKTCIIIKCTCMRIISKIGLVDQSKLYTQNYLQKIASCIKLINIINNNKNTAK